MRNVLLKKYAIISFVAISFSGFSQTLKSYSWNEEYLLHSRARVFAKEQSLLGSLSKVTANAEKYVNMAPVNVTQKGAGWQDYFPKTHTVLPREYVSFSGYFWPVVGHEKDGTPWVKVESKGANSAMIAMYNAAQISTMQNIVVNCAKAYWFTDSVKYAQAAINQLRMWFIDPSTSMLPHMEHASFVPFDPKDSLGQKYGIIDMSGLHIILNSIELLRKSGLWTTADETGMKQWCLSFSNWLQNGMYKDEGRVLNNNNHGIYYDVILIAQWLYLGNNYNGVDYVAKAKSYIQTNVYPRIADQLGSGQLVVDNYGTQKINETVYDGFWLELGRPNASMYNGFALDGLCFLAMEAQKLDIDLWNYTTPKNQSIKKSIEWYLPYIIGSKKWTFGDEVTNPFKGATGFYWNSALYIPEHEALFNNYCLNQSDMYGIDNNEQNLFSPRAYYYYDDFVCNLIPKNLKFYRGGTWTPENGALDMANSSVELANKTPGSLIFHGTWITGDYDIKAHMKLTSSNTNDGIGISFMAYTSTNYGGVENYYYLLLSKNPLESGVYKVKGNGTVTGTTRTKIISCNRAITENIQYNIQIKRLGNTTFFYLDSVKIGQMVDMSYTGGVCGFCLQNGTCAVQDVRIQKAKNSAPEISIQLPQQTIFIAPATLQISATTLDYDGVVSKVVFYNGTQKNAEDVSFPFEFQIQNLPTGTYSFFAVAYDNLGDSTISSSVTCIVQMEHTITLQQGWNLISTNVYVSDSSIEKLFANLDVEMVKDMYGFWKKGQDSALHSLHAITAGEGYLVYMNAAGMLTVSGTPMLEKIHEFSLQNGWNLIGYPGCTDAMHCVSTSFSNYFNSTNCQIIKNFDGFWIPNGTLNSIQNFESGKGYFINK